jgi:hypothetical protein
MFVPCSILQMNCLINKSRTVKSEGSALIPNTVSLRFSSASHPSNSLALFVTTVNKYFPLKSLLLFLVSPRHAACACWSSDAKGLLGLRGPRSTVVVEALCYKPEGHKFDS